MSGWQRLVVVALILVFPMPASAWLRGRRTTSASYYYYPPSVVYVPGFVPVAPLAVAPAPCPPLMPPARLYATPTPAPASTLAPAPAAAPAAPATPGPGVSESRSSNYPPAASRVTESRSHQGSYSPGVREADGRVSVAFWNLTSRDLTLKVDGQVRVLPPGTNVTLDMPRRFVWQIDAREAEVESVPAQQSGLDIVVRR